LLQALAYPEKKANLLVAIEKEKRYKNQKLRKCVRNPLMDKEKKSYFNVTRHKVKSLWRTPLKKM
jgi:hypothetical protein